jgi:DNA repair exonuclease SbcCD ATPase subunit
MNDNLRYVSLQYIKGDNYEDVDSFKEKIRDILYTLKDADLLDNPEEVKKLYRDLDETLEKKKIGESFLEDLINYSSLKLIKKDLDEEKKTAEKKIKELKEESKKIGNGNEKKGAFLNARSKIAGLLLDVIEVLDMVKRGENNKAPYLDKIGKIGDVIKELIKLVDDNDTGLKQHITSDLKKLKEAAIKSVEKFKSDAKINNIDNVEKLLTDISSSSIKIDIGNSSNFDEIKKAIKQADAKAADAAKANVLFDNVEFAIKKLNKEFDIENANDAILTKLKDEVEKLKVLENAAKEAVEEIKTAKAPAAGARGAAAPAAQTPEEAQQALSKALNNIEQLLENAKNTLEEAYKLLEELHKDVIKKSDALEKDKKVYLKSLDSLVALYSSYINICKKNILKYDKLFEHNEISNIDEAFMIKSYSDFLKKLNKLKKNLETKDINKIRRALTDSINRLFNMYGVNTNNEAFMKALFEGYNDNGTDKDDPDAKDDKKNKDIDYIIERIINYNLAK